MLESIVIRAGDGNQQFMSRDLYGEYGQYSDPRFCNFAVVQPDFNVRGYAQGAENLFDVYNNVKTETSAQRQ